MPTRYGVSAWTNRLPKRRRPSYPAHKGHLDVEVAIVGGGLTGCATACAFATAGVPVALFEAGRLAGGSTAHAPGLVAPDPLIDFRTVHEAHGLKAARHAWQASRRASLDFVATLRRFGIRADVTVTHALRVAVHAGEAVALRREYDALRQAGLDAAWLRPPVVRRETGIEAAGAVRGPKAAFIDPLRACLGLARAAAQRGARLYEATPVRKIRGGRKAVEIRTERGTVRAQQVVIATGAPTRELFRSLMRHVRPIERYAVVTPPLPAVVRRALGSSPALLADSAAPPHLLRRLRDDRLLVAGADGAPTRTQQRRKVVVQRAGQLMYELSLLYPIISGIQPELAWEVPDAVTRDGLPFIGPHRNYGRHLFAFGFGQGGAGLAHLAARIFVRRYLEKTTRADEVFGFSRIL